MEKEIREGKFFAAISYITFLCIVSLVLKKDNKFALHHAKQGLVLFVFEVVCFIVSIIPILGWLIAVLGLIVFPVFCAWGILGALRGNLTKLPVVADIAKAIVL